jgi:LysM repeat protein
MLQKLFRATAIAIFLTLLAVNTPVQAQTPAWSTLGYHTVLPGQTLFCIARAYGVSPWSIASYNGIIHPNVIYPGRALAIPNAYATVPAGPTCARQFPEPAPGVCTCRAYHTVITGETLSHISLRYGANMWRIAACNGITNLNYIQIGQVLCIPTS